MLFDPLLLDLPEQLDTQRLLIRPPRRGDGRAVYEAVVETLDELRRYPSSLRWALEEPTPERSESFCRRGAALWQLRVDMPLLLFDRADGTLVGASGLHRFDWADRRFEIGWWCRRSRQGQGYVTEGGRAIVDFAFEHLAARRVFALGDDANAASWRVCERLGMTLEGVLRGERADPDGSRRDMRVYAVTR
jgi:RimJ/RimL family protein N-acetyltransferase